MERETEKYHTHAHSAHTRFTGKRNRQSLAYKTQNVLQPKKKQKYIYIRKEIQEQLYWL